MVEISDEQAAYLRERQVGVLATSRKDGSPQQSMITYLFDGEHIVISTVKTSAKHHNVRRQPRVSLLVPDGKQQVIVYGTAEVLGGREATATSWRSGSTRVIRSPRTTTSIGSAHASTSWDG